MRRYQGWVSLPILLMVVVFSLLLVRHQESINSSAVWQVQRSQQVSSIWQDGHLALKTIPATLVGEANCLDFCSPKKGKWQSVQINQGAVWLQKQRIEQWGVERWCITKDQQQIRCWWHYDNGESSTLWLRD